MERRTNGPLTCQEQAGTNGNEGGGGYEWGGRDGVGR